MQSNIDMSISVAIVCDFYFPELGGVELQIKELAKYLHGKINNVVVITHCRPKFYGQMVIEGVKTYYLPRFYSQTNVIFPTFFMEYPEAKNILMKEKINIVHVHQSSSPLGICYSIFGYFLGLKIIHTEHSLYGSTSLTDMHFNWAMTAVYEIYDKFICVSRATRNNFILRCHVNSSKIIIIPNAVQRPQTQISLKRKIEKIKIAIVSRMVYRRGIDLLIQLIPIICKRYQNIKFQIIGDGPKLNPLRQIIKRQQLQSCVQLYGKVENKQTLQIVKTCQIYLSTALTQSFGIAIIQASYLGLQCISTNVGGVSQILPSHQLRTVDCKVDHIIQQLQKTIQALRQQEQLNIDVDQKNQQSYYDKDDCFKLVLQVYNQCLCQRYENKMLKVFKRISSEGSLPGILLIIVLLLIKVIDGVINLFQKVKSKYQ